MRVRLQPAGAAADTRRVTPFTLPGSTHPLEVLPVAGPPDHPDAYATVLLTEGAASEPVLTFAAEHGLDVDDTDPNLKLIGPPDALASAFGVHLELVDHPRLGRFRRQVGPVQVPSSLDGIVEHVLGLDDRPVARPYNHGPYLPHTVPQPVTPLDLASIYGFPQATGKEQLVGVIELGGALNQKDLTTYLQQLNVTHTGKVQAIAVDGAKPVSDGPDGADGEVMLDVEVIAAVAPAANLRVYFAPNTDAGFVNAIARAVSDGCKIISISWGGPEDAWTPASRAAMDKAFQTAITAGVTVLCAAGDNGSGDGERGVHVDYPAASPYVTGCGGTRVVLNGGTFTETVWNDNAQSSATGGGYSTAYPAPAWQEDAIAHGPTGRGVPDVAGNADPQSGYRVVVDGQSFVIGGTSAVAPLWAGLIARVNELRGAPAGFINPKLYAGGQLRDITSGGNGAYKAAPGWDPCTGLGSPDGPKVLAALGVPSPTPGPTPTPTPEPGPDDADKALWAVARDWVENHRHTGEAKTVATALRDWAAAEGLK